ncbi:MAG: nuclear transport factor 2 family protein [Caldilineaceae bacterium]|nr:nuclear transport factor 2 family protein [Caldilineaceae bacterium]MCB0092657.1 nuclear transport factor 2 family protein [Caldilineaceae bacterium]MCB0097327.1 nuclear transport factor 2 family protein [Caldilineaceae bacterium]MCB9150174.1 nuclear transport factor 2 family protein [Caldilineaceae bacterium]
MYHYIVKRKLRKVFAGLNAGKIEAVTDELSDQAVHYFIGQHALSGTRRTPDSIRLWYQRLLRLLPDIHFDLENIHVQGFPWATLAAVPWTESNSGTDGVRTSNEGLNLVRIAWGRVVEVRIYTDTQVLVATLDRLAAANVTEAHAPPIIS